MTENDYIAEYIKEKHPSVLGINFALWKIGRVIRNTIHEAGKILATINTDELKEIMDNAAEKDDTTPEKESGADDERAE